MAVAVELKPLAPAEAISFFRQKGYRTTFSWQDMFHEQHAQAFTVAGVSRLDVLQDVRSAMDEAIASGTTFEQFKKMLQPKLAAKGWWGPVTVKDEATGEEKIVDLSRSRRLQTIFNVNMRTSYAAGHWARIQRTKDVLPYLRYSAVLDRRTRPMHRLWSGTVLPVDDPWWDTHYPPCGWNCRCTVVQMSKGMVERAGLRVQPEGPMSGSDQVFKNNRTGEIYKVPPGIDPGFGYNVGKTATFPDPAKYTDATIGRAAAQLSVDSENFAQLLAQNVPGSAPVAWLDDVILQALKADVRRVDLASDVVGAQVAAHPELTLGEYRQLPQVLGDGLVVEGTSDGTFQFLGLGIDQAGQQRVYRAVVQRAASGQALLPTAFQRATASELEVALAAKPVRDQAALRGLQLNANGVVGE